MDRHLNVFLPYDRSAHHEDQLTRAAMIVIRAIPLARDALLARIKAPSFARLPEPELEMQTSYVQRTPEILASEPGPSWLHELISVFLSPDEGLNLSDAEIRERATEQRLDGVLRFGDELVVVIESKTVLKAPTVQATELTLPAGVQVRRSRAVPLAWHELLEDWWALLERGLLAPAERMLMEDLVAFAEEHFAHLLPFTTLGRADDHDLRRRRRLVTLLREATGLNDHVEPTRAAVVGASVMTDAVMGTRTTQRIVLLEQDGNLMLATYPAELKPKAQALYQTGRAQQLIDFVAKHAGTWQARPNIHLAFHNAPPAQRLYLHCHLDIADYIRRWAGDDFEKVRLHPHDRIRHELWPWLRERQYAAPEDDEHLDAFLQRLGRRDAHLRPSITLQRTWSWAQAVELDEHGALASEIHTAINELLRALDEPLLPARNRGTAIPAPPPAR